MTPRKRERKMTRKIFRSTLFASLCVFIVAMILVYGALYDYFIRVEQKQIKSEAEMIGRFLDLKGEKYLDEINDVSHRVTWIDPDGRVIYDNRVNPSDMENHGNRKEVKEAFENGYGESARYSKTMANQLLYSAYRLEGGSVIRISVEEKSMPALIVEMFQPILFVGILAVILSLILASLAARRIVKPLNALDLENPLSNEAYDELSPLFRRIYAQQKELREKEKKLLAGKREFDAVTSNMSEGLTLLNSKGEILSINDAAKHIFGADDDCVGKSALTINRSPELLEAFEMLSAGKRSEKKIGVSGRYYQLAAEPVRDEKGEVSGSVILLYDISEKEKAESMRREFTANVSHELKTPLQTISGCIELLDKGMVRPEDVGEFYSSINTETKRMISLVDDIIDLSSLDEYYELKNPIPVDIWKLARDKAEALEQAAVNAGVLINTRGESVIIKTVPKLASNIIYNICENAVKYNKKGGHVNISVEKTDEGALFTCEDTGIGIPSADRSRVFERFYRVDKSRSKAGGGTGLGLSIVKHAAEILKARIELNSEEGKGTTVKVFFPEDMGNIEDEIEENIKTK
jgi:two-component system phosphate regulon sensor histidine kinase PhoR